MWPQTFISIPAHKFQLDFEEQENLQDKMDQEMYQTTDIAGNVIEEKKA